jgi:hypothetical protein
MKEVGVDKLYEFLAYKKRWQYHYTAGGSNEEIHTHLQLDQQGSDLLANYKKSSISKPPIRFKEEAFNEWTLPPTPKEIEASKENAFCSHLRPHIPNALPSEENFSMSSLGWKVKRWALNVYFFPWK